MDTEKTARSATGTALADAADAAVDTVRRWLRASAATPGAHDAAAARLAAVLQDPNGLDFTVGFVDRVIGTEDYAAAARALREITALVPDTLTALDRAQIRAGAALVGAAPRAVVTAARARLRSMVGHLIVDARERPFGRAVKTLRADGHRLNINLLGEAVLGDDEAGRHLEDTRRLLARPDVDYVSIKVSSIASQLSMWAFEDTVQDVVARLRPLYLEAARAPQGTRFINLDMEEYRDLELTLEVFTRLLSEPGLEHYEAGIVLQAYLPDALGAMQRLSDFAARRVAAGGAGIKVRLVKGANLAMERVHAEIAGWTAATCPDKESTDANYKLVLHWLFDRARMSGVRVGVAGHNLFDIAFAHELARRRGVADRVEFEMLQGMAADHAEAVSADVGRLLLYVPAVRPSEFDVAISYLVRRLEENAQSENFMSGVFDLRNGNAVFRREEERFRSSVAALRRTADALGPDGAPEPRRSQHRALPPAPEAAPPPPDAAPPALPGTVPPDAAPPDFVNEPDTDPSLPANQSWARALRDAGGPDWLAGRPAPEPLESAAGIDALVSTGRAAAAGWRGLGASARAQVLLRAASIVAQRRGEFLMTMAAEVGKTFAQADPEVSEAIDFIRYYAARGIELDDVHGARFVPDSLVLVTPPWNFPVAIPTGSTVAALAAGAAVIHKPSGPTPRCSALIAACLWDAGVPRDVLQLVAPAEGDIGGALVSHPGIDRVILTGAIDTAGLFASLAPRLRITAETSGKNALVITPAADRDLAVADLVHSAFGHAGQKCSAASLAIMVGSVHDSARYRRQLVDAASSLVVGWPDDLAATVGPLSTPPSDKLLRALTELEPGESWLLEPRRLDDSGRLWSPGIKDGVAPGSFFHLTECFGPVLGLMRADSLDEAIELQNAVDYGLTAGIHSLDPDEVELWADSVQAGNLYANRSITGAIVRRQPFGGWKKSSVGLGSKAGGPNYLMQFGTWHPAAVSDAEPGTDAWVAAGAADDRRWYASEFGRPADPSGLEAEANIFRYLPRPVVVRVGPGAHPAEVERIAHAAGVVGSPLTWSVSPEAPAGIAGIANHAASSASAPCRVEDATAFAARVRSGELDDSVGVRIRVLGELEDDLAEARVHRPEAALVDDPVTASGRVELRAFVHEQAVSITLHRHGNPSRGFHALADRLCPARAADAPPPGTDHDRYDTRY